MLDTIRSAWGWTGLDPVEIIATNSFGNLIIRATDGGFWRICPEEWMCQQIADSPDAYAALSHDEDFQADWEMEGLVELAQETLGPLTDGQCYCLKLPGIVGGDYEASNLGSISIDELIAFSGNMAERVKDLPEGTPIEFEIGP